MEVWQLIFQRHIQHRKCLRLHCFWGRRFAWEYLDESKKIAQYISSVDIIMSHLMGY
jgi:hypothetical protein